MSRLSPFASAAAAAQAGRPLVLPDGDAVHSVALLEAILASARTQAPVRLA